MGLKREAGFLKVVFHQVRVRPRLTIAALVGITTYVAYPHVVGDASDPTQCALVAWDVGALLYLVLAWSMMLRHGGGVEKMKWRSRLQDDGARVVLVLTLAATVASLAAIVLELVHVQQHAGDPTPARVLAGVTIFLSWCFVHTAFALHYAHEYYVDRGPDGEPGLEFPGGGSPDYLDFLYFSFVIGTTSQTADVSIASRGMRRLALAHGIVAFVFNTTLLALTVNIAAGLLGEGLGR